MSWLLDDKMGACFTKQPTAKPALSLFIRVHCFASTSNNGLARAATMAALSTGARLCYQICWLEAVIWEVKVHRSIPASGGVVVDNTDNPIKGRRLICPDIHECRSFSRWR